MFITITTKAKKIMQNVKNTLADAAWPYCLQT